MFDQLYNPSIEKSTQSNFRNNHIVLNKFNQFYLDKKIKES